MVLPVDWTAATATAELFVKALLLGIDHGLPDDASFADAFPVEVLPFEDAVKYMRARLPMSRDEYYALDDKMRFRAFTVSRLADSDAVERVQGFLSKGLEEGSTLADFRRMTNEELLDAAGLGTRSGWYWETVYRTNQQTAYNVGRALGYASVPPLALELIGVEDSRQTEICRNLTVPPFRRPYNDPVWKTLWPPFHFGCRTFARAIYDQAELGSEGDSVYSIAVPDAPEAGWGNYPLDGSTWWELTPAMKERAEKAGLAREIEEARKELFDDTPISSFREAATLREAEDYAVRVLGANYSDYRGVDLVTANEWNRGAFDNLNRFPALRGSIRFLGESRACYNRIRTLFHDGVLEELSKINPGVDAARLEAYAKKLTTRFMRQLHFSDDHLALSWRLEGTLAKDATGITVGKADGSDSEKLLGVLARGVESRFHPVGCTTIRSVLDHEIGHKLDDLLDISKDRDILSLYKGLSRDELTEGLSRYTWDNRSKQPIKEFIAEGWSEYCNNPAPRPIAREIGEIIERRYAEWTKLNS